MLHRPLSIAASLAACVAVGTLGAIGFIRMTTLDETDVSAVPSNATTLPKPLPVADKKPTPEGKGPWNNDLRIVTGVTLDALSEPTTFVERAGVPSLIQRMDGSLLAAFQWFPEDDEKAFDNIAVSKSFDDGATWSDPVSIKIFNYPEANQRPFDPTLVEIGDGHHVRLYFTSSPLGDTTTIHSAISDDGIEYEYEGEVFAMDGVNAYDAAAVVYDDVWHLATPIAPDGGMYYATSSDGLTFTQQNDITNGQPLNWTGNFTTVDSTAYFFGTLSADIDGIWFTDSNDMKTWSKASPLGIRLGADPAAIHIPSQGWVIIYVSEPVR